MLLASTLLLGTAQAIDLRVDKEITLDGKKLPWPATLADVEKVLGPADRVTELMNRIHTWDKLGVTVYVNGDKSGTVEELCLQLAKEPYAFSPREPWTGKAVVFGADAANKTGDAAFEQAGFTRKGSPAFYKFRKVQNGFLVTVDSVKNTLGWTRVSVSAP